MILEFLRAETIGVLLSIAFVFELIAEGVVVEVVSEFTLPIAEAANRTQRVVMVIMRLFFQTVLFLFETFHADQPADPARETHAARFRS